MASWSEIETEAPKLVTTARRHFDSFKHKTIATLRADGSPRISGTEVIFHGDDLYIGSMLGAVKARDLLRDGRFALHSGSADPPKWPGDAKVAGQMVEVTDPSLVAETTSSAGEAHLFRADIDELVVVGLNDERTKLVIESWHAGRGIDRIER